MKTCIKSVVSLLNGEDERIAQMLSLRESNEAILSANFRELVLSGNATPYAFLNVERLLGYRAHSSSGNNIWATAACCNGKRASSRAKSVGSSAN